MKFLKILTSIIIIFIVVCLITLYFLPVKYQISTSVTINEPAALTFNFINSPEKLKEWFPMDNIEIISSDNQIGSGIKWIDNPEINNGQMVCRAIYPNDSIIYSIALSDNRINALSRFTLYDENDKCTINWTIAGKMHYLFRWMAFFKEKYFAGMMNKGMQKLKTEVEKIGKVNVKIERAFLPDGQMLLATRDTIPKSDNTAIDELANLAYLEIFNFIEKNNIEFAGPPLTIYYNKKNNLIVDFAIPIINRPNLKGNERIKLMELYSGPVLKAKVTNSKKNKEYAYQLLDAFMKKNNFKINEYYWEENINNSPNNYLLNIYYPIKK